MTRRSPPATVAALPGGITDRLAGADGLLVGADFDGTLAPIADDPDEPTITPECRRALAALAAHPDATAAVISGRGLSDLLARVGLDGIVYAGNHGLELYDGRRAAVHPMAVRLRPVMRRVLDELADRLGDVPGCEIEDKGLTAAVHVRRTPRGRTDEVRSAVEATVRAAGGDLWFGSGKEVFELRPAVRWDKGSTIGLLSAGTPDGWRTVYLGDDETDEDAFRAVRPDGLGVLVGSRVRTEAACRLATQASVAPFLDWLIDGVLERRCTARS